MQKYIYIFYSISRSLFEHVTYII